MNKYFRSAKLYQESLLGGNLVPRNLVNALLIFLRYY